MLAAAPFLCALLATLQVPSGTLGGGFASAGTTVYHYDAGGRVLAETDAAGGTLREYFYFGNKLIAVGGCATASKACTEWYHTDTLGSVVARTNAAGEVVAQLTYEPWGEAWEVSGYRGDRQYNGRVFDPGTGFHDYGARMYWPQIGRFISVDPAGIHPENPQSWNRYAYVWNNPYKYVDPDGRDVTIAIQRDRYTPVSVSGRITVSSTVAGAGTFNGFTVETARAGPKGDKNPIGPGTYNAFVRKDHDPNRIELKNVPGFKNVQVHVGNTVDDVIGCFAVGQSREWTLYPEVDANGEVPGTYEVQKSTAAMAEINDIVKKDGTGKIKVEVTGSSTPPPQNSPP